MGVIRLDVFFKLVYGSEKGYVCVAAMAPDKRGLQEQFFYWPDKADHLVEWVNTYRPTHNVYFCPQILDSPKRRKEHVTSCPTAWADLDTCTPDKLLIPPTVTIESSPGRFQAVWVFEESGDPGVAESVSRRIAYYHAHHGADRSGWDLTQLLRVPDTVNFKYQSNPVVTVVNANRNKYRLSDFAEYPEVQGTALLTLPQPAEGELPTRDPLDLLQDYRRKMNPNTFQLFDQEPVEDWSKALWKLLMYCFEAGMSREEVFYIARLAKCNKYVRDRKPETYLWRDVCRAYLRCEENNNSIVTSSELEDLLSDEERRQVEAQDTFVERYVKWASGLGDAAAQYHHAGAFVILSSLLAGRVVLPTSFGTVLPNLWFMILADTTLTRKSTAMDIAMDLVTDVDQDSIMATDGSIEGLLTSMQGRPGRPSVFLRDEFSGLLEQITKKDYMAGMAETLTKLYDGKMQKRVLRKEIITITNPVLILFAGGIRTKVQSLLTTEHVSSGFVPRFIFVTATSNVSRLRPLGPPSQEEIEGREAILTEMEQLLNHYDRPVEQNGRIRIPANVPFKRVTAALTPDAWIRYNAFEAAMLKVGVRSDRAELMTPLYDRLAKSTLKAAVLLAACSQREETVLVDERHIVHAIKYAQDWRNYANEVVNGIGKTGGERELDVILQAIVRNPGISRSKLMQNYHLTARQADSVFSTLEQRNQITSARVGKGVVYYPDLGV